MKTHRLSNHSRVQSFRLHVIQSLFSCDKSVRERLRGNKTLKINPTPVKLQYIVFTV